MRLIDADVLRARLEGMMKAPWNAQSAPYCWAHAYEAMQEELDNAPTVEAEPVKRGRWIFGFDSETGERDLKAWTCSECNEKYPWQPNYCPNCGAIMDLEVEDGQKDADQ